MIAVAPEMAIVRNAGSTIHEERACVVLCRVFVSALVSLKCVYPLTPYWEGRLLRVNELDSRLSTSR